MASTELIGAVFNTPNLVIAIIAQGFVLVILFAVGAFFIVRMFISNALPVLIQPFNNQADAMHTIAANLGTMCNGITILKDQAVQAETATIEMRISLQALCSKIDNQSSLIARIERNV